MELSDEWVVTQWSDTIRAGVRRSESSRFTRAGIVSAGNGSGRDPSAGRNEQLVCVQPGYEVTRRDREVVDFTWYRIKNYSKLTNFRKLTRIEGYIGK